MKNKKQSNPRNGSIMALLCAVTLLLCFAAGNVASLLQSDTKGQDTVQLAAFAVGADAQTEGNIKIDCNQNANTAVYAFQVRNRDNNVTTDVTVQYKVTVTLPAALPEGVTLQIDETAGSRSENGLIYTFENSNWKFGAGVAGSNDHKLQFIADPATVQADYTLEQIQVQVTVTQVD